MNTSTLADQKIFIVDDDEMTQALYEQILSTLGFSNIKVFGSGQECISALTEEPKIIILDYNLGDMTGFDVLQKIKRFDPDIYVVFCSGQDDIQNAVNALKYGAFDYLVKAENDTENFTRVLKKIEDVEEMLRKEKGGRFKKFLSQIV